MVSRNISSDLEHQVKDFIARYCAVPDLKLSLQTRLVEDLGLVGDDAADLITAYAETFSVDQSDFAFDRYFPTAGSNPLGVIVDIFRKPKPLLPLTVGMLVTAAQQRRWGKTTG